MALKFRGSESIKVDSKGRLAIPARMRRAFEAGDPEYKVEANGAPGRVQLVMVYGPDNQNWFELYTMKAIDEIDQQIEMMDRGSKDRAWLEELMHAQAVDLEIDKENRLTIPLKLRERLGLDKPGEWAALKSQSDFIKLYHQEQPPADEQALDDHKRETLEREGAGYDPRIKLPKLKRVEEGA